MGSDTLFSARDGTWVRRKEASALLAMPLSLLYPLVIVLEAGSAFALWLSVGAGLSYRPG